MNLKSMLTRLEIAMNRYDLIEKMVLRPEPKLAASKKAKSATSVNFIVGYNGSPKSQTALDITLWMAHQTRLATSKEVTVQVVYVVPEHQSNNCESSPRTTSIEPSYFQAIFCPHNQFEQADKLLWQARCLADEWRGLFKAHLRFGSVGEELRKVVESEAATLLFLGCNSVSHSLVGELGSNFPCSVLGIPSMLNSHEDFYADDASKLQFNTPVSAH
ncbi:MAG TPA: universal stress protein [Kamptonema sp.]|nr:universal stress protein [Kamptonema sp.]